MQLLFWFIATVAMLYVCNFVYAAATARLARLFGLDVAVVCIGYDYFGGYRSIRGKHWEWRVGLFPFGAYVKFDDESSLMEPTEAQPSKQQIPPTIAELEGQPALVKAEPSREQSPPAPDGFAAAPLNAKICVALAGPMAQLAFSCLLLAIPIAAGGNQLVLTPSELSTVAPCAVGGLALDDKSTTISGQRELSATIGKQALAKYAFIENLDGWGGVFGSLITCAACARVDEFAWVTALGALFAITAVWNLLPIPPLNGGGIVIALCESAFGMDRRRGAPFAVQMIGLVLILVIVCRMLTADVFWLFDEFGARG